MTHPTTNHPALIPAGGRGALANVGGVQGSRTISYEKHALLLLNKEVGRYLVGLYLGANVVKVEKYKNPKNPEGITKFEEFSLLETNAPAADDMKVQRGDTVSLMGGGQLSKDLAKGDVRMKFVKLEYLGREAGQMADGTPGNFHRFRIVDVDAEVRALGFGAAADADMVGDAQESGDDRPLPEELLR